MEFDELTHLVYSVADDRQVPVDVVGVTKGEGGGCYAEVLVKVGTPKALVVIGVQRNAPPARLRAHIAERLIAASARP